jgi:hypothetical protein
MVDITAPSIPANLTRIVTGNSAALDWADATDATSGFKQYEVQLDKHSGFSSPEYSFTTTPSTAVINSLTDGTFYWRVRTLDNAGNYSVWTRGASFVSDVGGNINDALLLSSPSAAAGWVGLDDPADYYKLILDRAGKLSLNLTGITGDSNLTLYDGKGKSLKSSSVKGLVDENITNLALLAGDYFVKVAPADGGKGTVNTNYTLNNTVDYFPEDNASNTWQTAKDISEGVDNWVGFGDVADYYKLMLDSAGKLSLNMTGLSGDANLTLYDAKGRQLKISSNKATTDENISNLALPGGCYYVKVATGTSVTDAFYTLNNTVDYFPVDTVGNTLATAGLLKNNGLANEWVGFGDTADYYKLTLDSAGKLSLNMTGLSGDANLSLLNSAGKMLKSSSVRGTADENISNLALTGGDYYVKVTPGSGVNDASYTLSNAVDYFPGDTAGNTFALAQQVAENGPVNEWLGFGDKDDYYKFELQTGTAVTLDLTGITSNVNLYLYDSKNKQLAASAKAGNTDESISRTLTAGTYYVKATLAGKDNTDYSLNFNIDPSAFKTGSLKLFSAASSLTGSSNAVFTGNDPLQKSPGLLAS